MSGIKKITDEVKKRVKNSASSMSELTKKSQEFAQALEPVVQQTQSTMSRCEKATSEATKKMSKELSKIQSNKISIDVDTSNMNLDNLTYEELERKMLDLRKTRDEMLHAKRIELFNDDELAKLDSIVYKLAEIDEAMKFSPKALNIEQPEYNLFAPVKIQPDMSQVQSASQVIASSLNENLKNFDFLTLKEQIKTVAMQFESIIPAVSKVKSAIQENLSSGDSLLFKMIESVKNLGSAFSNVGSQAGKGLSNIKNSISEKIGGIEQTIKPKLEPIVSVAKNVGKTAGNALNQGVSTIKEKLNEVGNTPLGSKLKSAFSKAGSGVKNLIGKIKGVGSETDKVSKKGDGFGNSFGKSISKGVKSIKKFALSLLSVRSAFSVVSKASQAYLSFDSQLSASIQNSWNTLGSLLAPVLEHVAGLFSKLTSIVANFVKALTGVDLVAKANAKALDKQSKSASNANKQLASIDGDITNLSSDSGGSGDTQSITVEDVDMTPFENFSKKVAKVLSQIFNPFKEAWDKVGTSVINSIVGSFQNIGTMASNVFSSFMSVWTNGTGTAYLISMLTIVQQIFDLVGGLAGAFTSAWNAGGAGTQLFQTLFNASIGLATAFSSILKSFQEVVNNGTITTIFSNVIELATTFFGIIEAIAEAFTKAWDNAGVGNGIVQAICDIVIAIQDFVNSIGNLLLKWVVSDGFQKAIETVLNVISDILGYAKDITEWIVSMYEKYVKPVLDEHLFPAINELVEMIGAIWETAKPVIDKVVSWCKEKLEPVIEKITKAIGNIIDVARGVIKFFTGVFTGDWKKVWDGIKDIIKNAWEFIKNIFSAGGKIFDGIVGAIANVFKTIVNAIIRGINKVISFPFDKINGFLNTIRDISFLGIAPFQGLWGYNPLWVPQIPELAGGGVLTEETIVKVAEYSNARNNPEIVSPKDMLENTFRNVLNEQDFGGDRYDRLVINYMGKNVLNESTEYIREQEKIRGVSIVKGGAY